MSRCAPVVREPGPYYGVVFDPAHGSVSVTAWVDGDDFRVEAAFRESDGQEIQVSAGLEQLVKRSLLRPLTRGLNLG